MKKTERERERERERSAIQGKTNKPQFAHRKLFLKRKCKKKN